MSFWEGLFSGAMLILLRGVNDKKRGLKVGRFEFPFGFRPPGTRMSQEVSKWLVSGL